MSTTQHPIISLLIPTVDGRESYLYSLLGELSNQGVGSSQSVYDTRFIINRDAGKKSIGQKRNELLAQVESPYFAFIDDDDMVSPYYVSRLLDAARSGADCASLVGMYYLDGIFDRPFLHNLNIKAWYSDGDFHYRCPNHLNLIRTECVQGMQFNEINFGEDGKWSMQMLNEGRLKTQYEIKETLYHYYHRSKK